LLGKKTQTGLLEHIRVRHRDKIPAIYQFHSDTVTEYFSADAHLETLSMMVNNITLIPNLTSNPVPKPDPKINYDSTLSSTTRHLDQIAQALDGLASQADREISMDLDL
jgi:hypothetical protein